MKETKWNYAVVRTIFGDYWVGKTKLKADEKKIFKNIRYAIEKAQDLFIDQTGYDPEDEEADDETMMRYDEIGDVTEETTEEIKKGIVQFIK